MADRNIGLRFSSGSGGGVADGVNIPGIFEADETGVGFFGEAPVDQPDAYTVTNDNEDRAFDADSTTIDELADVIATMIADLQRYGLLQ